MSNDSLLIEASGISKKFCRDLKRSLWYGVKDSVHDLCAYNSRNQSNNLRNGEFWANHDLSFAVKRGECLGLIGGNGAGKTTVLKMLNGLIKPDSGQVRIRGKVAALIALGAGFNPVLTGRENILINGSILGLSRKRILAKLDEIVDFAELSDFIDSPVRSYSSGMNVRLGFAIATILQEPDVLILDEVLAVGDRAFRSKCFNRIEDLKKKSAVILVSHDQRAINLTCNRALHIEKGCLKYCGDVAGAFESYNNQDGNEFTQHIDREFKLHSFQIETIFEENDDAARFGFTIHFEDRRKRATELNARVLVRDSTRSLIAEWNSLNDSCRVRRNDDTHQLTGTTGAIRLRNGTYFIDLQIIGGASLRDQKIALFEAKKLTIRNEYQGVTPIVF